MCSNKASPYLAVVHKNPWFEVTLRVERDSKGETEWYRIRRNDSVIVIAEVDGELLMIYGHRDTVGDDLFYELPAGSIDKGEDALSAARRELKEEAGAFASQLIQIGQFVEAPGLSSSLTNIFVARDITFGSQELSDGENWALCRCSRAQINEYLQSGKIRDGQTLAALFVWDSWKSSFEMG